MSKHIFKLRRGHKDDATGRNDWAEYEKKPNHKLPDDGELVLEYDNGIPRLKIGDGINEFSGLSYMSIDSFILPKQESVHLSTRWDIASDNRYFQEVNVDNAIVTSKTKVDLQPTSEQLCVFHEKDLAFVAENEGGKIRVYCVGQVPQNSYDIPVTVTEIVTDDTKIVGNTTATPNPCPDWAQIDEKKADFIKNKPTLGALSAKDEVGKTDLSSDVQASLNKADVALSDAKKYTDEQIAAISGSGVIDKQEIINDVLASLPEWTGGSY